MVLLRQSLMGCVPLFHAQSLHLVVMVMYDTCVTACVSVFKGCDGCLSVWRHVSVVGCGKDLSVCGCVERQPVYYCVVCVLLCVYCSVRTVVCVLLCV